MKNKFFIVVILVCCGFSVYLPGACPNASPAGETLNPRLEKPPTYWLPAAP
jgi:hypothetical protein